MKTYRKEPRPTVTEIETELNRRKLNRSRRRSIGYIVLLSLVSAAVMILATNLWFPVYRVVGTSMQPQLAANDIVVCFDAPVTIERGEIVAFSHNETVLLKRVVGIPGDTIDMDESGVLYVNGEKQDEPYAQVLSREPCDIEFPVEVPEDAFFVLGDQRETSLDSRSQSIGMIGRERLIGKALVRIWPFDRLLTF